MTPEHLVKRGLDYVLAAGGLVATAPLLGMIAAAIHLEGSGGVLYVQQRLGREGRPFDLLKFRTMKPSPIRYNPDGSTKVDPSDDRVTRVGRYLRGALDELPQLLNILRGEMSLIGPRPDMASQHVLYAPEDERKLAVMPGITGLPVVLGRNDIPWKQRIAIDVWYVENWTLLLDLKILIQTLLMPLGVRAFTFRELPEALRSRVDDERLTGR